MVQINMKLISENAKIPEYKSTGASGMDVCSTERVILYPNEQVIVATGLSVEIPEGYEIQVRPRSGLAAKNGITVLNTPGTIDFDYRGEIKVILINLSKTPFIINIGDRIAQLVVCPVVQATINITDNLSKTERNDKGFGSSGV